MELAAGTKQTPTYFPTSTPIVDGLQPLPSRNPLRLNIGEYFFLSSASILYLIALPLFRRAAEALSSQGILLAALIVCLVIPSAALAAAIVAHEVGHLVAAWMAGFRLALSTAANPAGAVSGLKPYCYGLLRIGWWTLEPRRLDHLSRRLSVAVIGGPLANFLLPPILAIIVSAASPGPLTVFSAQVFSAMFLLLGIAESLPDMGRGASSDGARLLMLLRQDVFADRWLSLVRFQHAWNGNEQPSWDDENVSHIVAIDDDSRDAVAARWMAYWWSAERQDITSAAKFLEEALAAPSGSSDWLRDRLFLEAAVFQAWFREDLEKAGAWAARIRHRRLTRHQERRLSIALLWSQGRLFDAWERLGELLTEFQAVPASAMRDSALSNCLEWKRQMESRMLTRAWRALYSTTQDVDTAPNAQPDAAEPVAAEPTPLPN